MISSSKKIATFFILLILSYVALAAGTIHVKVDKQQLTIDDTLVLQLTISGDSIKDNPDMSAISHDFDIIGRSQSHRVSIINGHQDSVTDITYRLVPKKVGKITIPAISWGSYKTTPIEINITEQAVKSVAKTTPDNQQTQDAAKPVLMEIMVEPTSPYQDSQIRYRVKLLSSVALHNGKLTEPRGDDIFIYPETIEQRYEVIQNGKIYNVYERNYAIFPKKAGDIIIRSPQFTGQAIDALFASRRRLSGFDNSVIQINESAKKITVKAKPKEINNVWLPANDITLAEHWSDEKSALKVGEPIERTITLSAKGLTLNQLPEFQWQQVDGVKIYPGKVTTEERFDGKQVLSHRTQSVTYIPTKAGEYTLPEIRLPWFNIEKEKILFAKLPKHTFNITSVPITKSVSTTSGSTPSVSGDASSNISSTPVDDTRTGITLDKNILLFGLLLVVASSLFAGYYLSQRRFRLTVAGSTDAIQTPTSHPTQIKDIKQACLRQDMHLVRQLVHAWLAENKTCSTLEKQALLHAELTALDNLIYGQKSTPEKWNGKAFWHKLKKHLQR